MGAPAGFTSNDIEKENRMRRFLARWASVAIAVALLAGGAWRASARDDDERDNEAKNMKLVGLNDLQARSTYQPTLHKYGQNRYVIFTGHHALAGPGEGLAPAGSAPLNSFNPLTGKNEENGTSIVDVTNPRHPQYLAHVPVPNGSGGGAQMVRVCDGSTLPIHDNKVYMLRSYGTSAHEVWNVTDPSNPVGVRTVMGNNPVIGSPVTFGVDANGRATGNGSLAGTHKSWWECDTGIAYVVGRRGPTGPNGADTVDGWKGGNHIFIMDLSNPANPVFLRDWALDGQQPGGAIPPHFTSVPSIHGPISTGPDSPDNPIHGTGATLGRVYFAYGTGSNGVMQIVDRTKLLPPPRGTGVTCGSPASSQRPTACTDYHTAELGRWIMNPDNGAHTSFPLGKITIQDFITDTGNPNPGTVRDMVFVTSEATANYCFSPPEGQVRHLSWTVDVTEEGKPQSIATYQVSAASGRFCDRGGRFGPHATNEEFGPPFYQKLVFTSQFNAGVRVTDVRDPYNPKEVASFIPAVNANTDFRCAPFQGNPNKCVRVVQTNNVATDDRGFVYIVDRANSGMHALQLTGEAAKIAGLRSDD